MPIAQSTLAKRAAALREQAEKVQTELATIGKIDELLAELGKVLSEFPYLRPVVVKELAGLGEPDFSQEDWSDETAEDAATRKEELRQAAIDRVSKSAAFRDGTNLDRIVAFLRTQKGTPTTAAKISAATGVPQGSVRHVMYIRYPKLFRAKPGQHGLTLWQLLEDVRGETEPADDSDPEPSLTDGVADDTELNGEVKA